MADITGDADLRRRSLRPLRRLLPYIGQYRKLVIGAILSLTVAAATTLALPIAAVVMVLLRHAYRHYRASAAYGEPLAENYEVDTVRVELDEEEQR